MNFETSDEMSAMRVSLTRLLDDHYTAAHREALLTNHTAYAEQAWREIARLGLAGLQVPEEFGGFGTPPTDLMPVLQELGRTLAPVPFTSSCVLGAAALRTANNPEARRDLLPPLAAGTLQLTGAHELPAPTASVTAVATSNSWHLYGLQKHIPYAACADWIFLDSRGEDLNELARGLFLVAAGAEGLQLRGHRLIDGTPAADIQLQGVSATPLCLPGSIEAKTALNAIAAAGIAAACAEMVGCMEAALGLTVDYLKTRKQFGRLIGENQALRHRIAEMAISLEMARSLSIAASIAAGKGGFEDAISRADLHRAKFLVGRNARSLCQTAIQLHGGIGMTEEYRVGHYLRRVHVLDRQFGDGSHHLEHLMALS